MLYEARGRHVSRTNVSHAREASGQQMPVYDYLLCSIPGKYRRIQLVHTLGVGCISFDRCPLSVS
jgi:hypothetical protein